MEEFGQEVKGQERHPAADEDDHDKEEHLDSLFLVLHAHGVRSYHRMTNRRTIPQLEDNYCVTHALQKDKPLL